MLPPSSSFSQANSISASVSHTTKKEMEGLILCAGPPLRPMNLWPASSKLTTIGVSEVILVSGKTEQYRSAAALACPSNQRQG